MLKAIVFDIKDKKNDQREAEMTMDPLQSLSLCLDLMDLSIAISSHDLVSRQDGINWIELPVKNA